MVGNRVKERREELGISQEQLAQESGVGRSTIAEIESGKHTPSVETALYLTRALNTTINELFWLI